MPSKSFVSAWRDMARLHPDSQAVTIGDAITLTWGELDRQTNQVGRLLAVKGVQSGDFVTIALPTGVKAVEAIIATIKIGATPNVISARLPAPERQKIIELVDPRIVIDESGEQLTDHPVVPGWDEERDHYSTDELPEVISPVYKAPTSGGSTGRPKIILSGSPAVIDDSPDALIRRIGFPTEGVILFPGPISHNTAQMGLLIGLALKNHVILEERFDPELTLRLIDRHKVQFAVLVPTMMNRISRLPADVREKYRLSSLKLLQHNAGSCPPDLKREWIERLGPDRLYENYTSTEQVAMTMVSGTDWLARPGTVGRTVVGEIEVRDEDGQKCPPGEVGTIWMRRLEGVPRTFSYKGQETPEPVDGWETVGDLGTMDADGFLFLADRRVDMIISGGANIYPAEVEAVISSHPSVVESVVVGIPDYDMGQLVHAIVTVDCDGLEEAELDAYVRARLAGYKCPRTYEFTSVALRDEAGKVRRQSLREERIAAASATSEPETSEAT